MRTFEGIIIENKLHTERNSREFGTEYDYTDHFSFICNKCSNIAQVERVSAQRDNEKFGQLGIFFRLHCPKCRTNGLRKIWIKKED